MKTIIQKPIIHINSEELPNQMYIDILGGNYDEEPFNEIYEGKATRMNDPIKIDVLRKYLDQLEHQGANYVSIDFHTDHNELEMDGLNVRIATQEEIDLHNQKDKDDQINMIKNKITECNKVKLQFESRLKELSGE